MSWLCIGVIALLFHSDRAEGNIDVSEVLPDATQTQVNEIFIIGDLHADLKCATSWVEQSGLVDMQASPWEWLGGPDARLVFLGDYVDKGPHGRHVLELVRDLTEAFPLNVVALMGNHDFYLLLDAFFVRGASDVMGVPVRDFSYAFTHPEEYLNWIPPEQLQDNDTSVVLPALYAALQAVYAKNAEGQVMMKPHRGKVDLFSAVSPFKEDEQLASAVRGRLAEWQKFMAEGLEESGLGRWLSRRPFWAVLGGALIVHGGLPLSMLQGLEARTKDAGTSLSGRLEEVTNSAFERFWAQASPAAMAVEGKLGPMLAQAGGDAELIHELTVHRGYHGGRYNNEKGPSGCDEVKKVLKQFRSAGEMLQLVVVGHTPEKDVRATCGGRLVAADSSLSRYFRKYGNRNCPAEADAPRDASAGCGERRAEECQGRVTLLRLRPGRKWNTKLVRLGDAVHTSVSREEL